METADDVQLRPVTGAANMTRKSESNTRDAEETMPERAHQPEQHDPALEPQYPSPARFWMALTTLSLGIFLITLVSHPGSVPFLDHGKTNADADLPFVGQHYRCNRHPLHYGRVSLTQRRWLVWQHLPHGPLHVPASLRQAFSTILGSLGLFQRHVDLPCWLRRLWGRTQLSDPHRRSRHRRPRFLRSTDHGLLSRAHPGAAGQASSVPEHGLDGPIDRCYRWSVGGRSTDPRGLVALGLLHQPATWRCPLCRLHALDQAPCEPNTGLYLLLGFDTNAGSHWPGRLDPDRCLPSSCLAMGRHHILLVRRSHHCSFGCCRGPRRRLHCPRVLAGREGCATLAHLYTAFRFICIAVRLLL